MSAENVALILRCAESEAVWLPAAEELAELAEEDRARA